MAVGMFTFLLHYEGEAYLLQVWASTVEGAVRAWAGWLQGGAYPDVDESKVLAPLFSGFELEPVNGVRNVWSIESTHGDPAVPVHIVASAENEVEWPLD